MTAAGAVASLVAFGATFLGTALLLMFNPASRAVRWYAAFNITLLLWLGAQGVALMSGARPVDLFALRVAVTIMPAVFLAAAVAHGEHRASRWLPMVIVAAGVLAVPLLERAAWSVARFWHIGVWLAAAAVYVGRALVGRSRRPAGSRRSTRSEKILELVLSGFVPVGVIGAIMAQGSFVILVLPVLTIVVMLLVFSGVVFHRFYDIEVRAARSGELAASAAEHDRLALLGELSATIAHEVRNPLTGIRSLTQLMGEPRIADEKRLRYANVILGEVGRLDRIVGNLTDLARRSGGTTAATGSTVPSELFDDLLLLVDARARRAAVSIDARDEAGGMKAPREALAQALLNLLLNAIAHSPAGSTITLRARECDGGTAIDVADQGPGVPEPERERIFEPFTTQGGTGLGLAVVRRLAGEHGWTVAVDDAPGGGARFTIHVPGSARVT